MANLPPNYINEMLMGLLSNTRMPMRASPGLAERLRNYKGRRPGAQPDMTNVIDPLQMTGVDMPAPISMDPWFDDVQMHQDDPSGRKTLIGDMMRATGIEPRGSYDRYYSQLMEVDDAFVQRVARQLGLETQGLQPNQIRSLLATEFEHYSK